MSDKPGGYVGQAVLERVRWCGVEDADRCRNGFSPDGSCRNLVPEGLMIVASPESFRGWNTFNRESVPEGTV